MKYLLGARPVTSITEDIRVKEPSEGLSGGRGSVLWSSGREASACFYTEKAGRVRECQPCGGDGPELHLRMRWEFGAREGGAEPPELREQQVQTS